MGHTKVSLLQFLRLVKYVSERVKQLRCYLSIFLIPLINSLIRHCIVLINWMVKGGCRTHSCAFQWPNACYVQPEHICELGRISLIQTPTIGWFWCATKVHEQLNIGLTVSIHIFYIAHMPVIQSLVGHLTIKWLDFVVKGVLNMLAKPGMVMCAFVVNLVMGWLACT